MGTHSVLSRSAPIMHKRLRSSIASTVDIAAADAAAELDQATVDALTKQRWGDLFDNIHAMDALTKVVLGQLLAVPSADKRTLVLQLIKPELDCALQAAENCLRQAAVNTQTHMEAVFPGMLREGLRDEFDRQQGVFLMSSMAELQRRVQQESNLAWLCLILFRDKSWEMRDRVCRPLFERYHASVQSLDVPPVLGRGLTTRSLLTACTRFLTDKDLLHRLGRVDRAWNVFMFWNVYALAGEVNTRQYWDKDDVRWAFCKRRSLVPPTLHVNLVRAPNRTLDMACSLPRLNTMTVDFHVQCHEKNPMMFRRLLIDGCQTLCHLIVMCGMAATSRFERRDSFHNALNTWCSFGPPKALVFRSYWGDMYWRGSDCADHPFLWLPELQKYPRVIRTELSIGSHMDTGKVMAFLPCFYEWSGNAKSKGRLPGVERIEVVVSGSAGSKQELEDVVKQLQAKLHPGVSLTVAI